MRVTPLMQTRDKPGPRGPGAIKHGHTCSSCSSARWRPRGQLGCERTRRHRGWGGGGNGLRAGGHGSDTHVSGVCLTVCCSVSQCVAVSHSVLQVYVSQCVAVRCSVLQCVAVCCSALQCVAVTPIFQVSVLFF